MLTTIAQLVNPCPAFAHNWYFDKTSILLLRISRLFLEKACFPMKLACTVLFLFGIAIWLLSVQSMNQNLAGLPSVPPVCILLGGVGTILLLSKKHGPRS